jgi:dihydrofolate reductase
MFEEPEANAAAIDAITSSCAYIMGLIDEVRLHVSPVLLGAGERLFDGVGDLDLEPVDASSTKLVTHLTYRAGHAPGSDPG